MALFNKNSVFMSLKKYLIGMGLATLLCWAAWGLILFYIDPYVAGITGLVCFYLSLFFALTGTFTLIGLTLRIWFSHNEIIFAYVGVSFRQAVLLASVIGGCLILQQLRVLNWWDGSLLAISIGLLEFYFMTRS